MTKGETPGDLAQSTTDEQETDGVASLFTGKCSSQVLRIQTLYPGITTGHSVFQSFLWYHAHYSKLRGGYRQR